MSNKCSRCKKNKQNDLFKTCFKCREYKKNYRKHRLLGGSVGNEVKLFNIVKGLLNKRFKYDPDKRKERPLIKEYLQKYYPNPEDYKLKKNPFDNAVYTGVGLLKRLIQIHINKFSKNRIVPFLKIINQVIKHIFGNGQNTYSSRTTFFVDIRKMFTKGSDYYKKARKYLEIGEKEFLKNKRIQKDKVEEKNKNPLEFHYDEMLEYITNNYDSMNYKKRAIALLLASGSRPIELVYVSGYDTVSNPSEIPYDNLPKNVLSKIVKVMGIAKRRDDEEITLYRPVINLSAEQFVASVRILKDYLYDLTDGVLVRETPQKTIVLNQNIQKAILRQVRIDFPENNVKTQTLRKFYGVSAYKRYGSYINRNINLFLQQVLGHSEFNLTSSFNYTTAKISDDNTNLEKTPLQNEELIQKVTELTDKLNNLEIKEGKEPKENKIKTNEERIIDIIDNLKQQKKAVNKKNIRVFMKEQGIKMSDKKIYELIKKYRNKIHK